MSPPDSDPDADHHWMGLALALARQAAWLGEVPVGAVVVQDGYCLAAAHNQPIARHDPSAHAEMLALRQAAARVGNYRLPGATLYATLEPCPMCAGAILHARIQRVVFGAWDERGGGAGSVVNLLDCPPLNHRVEVLSGVRAAEASALLRIFFRLRRRRGFRTPAQGKINGQPVQD